MSQETFLRARLEIELRSAHEELARLEAERLRLSRKNEMLSATMYDLRSEHALPELALRRIEEALAFDGQPWADDRQPDEDDEELDDDGDIEPIG
jgi:hypothetical protein